MAVRRSGSSGCCASISCSTGSICRIRRWKRRSTIRWRCGVLLASISAASRCQTRPRCAASATCSRSTISAGGLFDEVRRHLAAKGLKGATGTIVDATFSFFLLLAARVTVGGAYSYARGSVDSDEFARAITAAMRLCGWPVTRRADALPRVTMRLARGADRSGGTDRICGNASLLPILSRLAARHSAGAGGRARY